MSSSVMQSPAISERSRPFTNLLMRPVMAFMVVVLSLLFSTTANAGSTTEGELSKKDRRDLSKAVTTVMRDFIDSNPRYYRSVSDLQEKIEEIEEDDETPRVLSLINDWQTMLVDGQTPEKPPRTIKTNGRWSKPIELDGLSGRKAICIIPKDYKKIKPIPVVLALHPDFSGEKKIEDKVADWAEETFTSKMTKSFAVVVPINETDSKWADEGLFILTALSQTVLWNLSYDPGRLALLGMGDAAGEAYRLGTFFPSMFSGIIVDGEGDENIQLENLTNSRVCLVGGAKSFAPVLDKVSVPHDEMENLEGLADWMAKTEKSFYPSTVNLQTGKPEFGAAYWVMAPRLDVSGGNEIARLKAICNRESNEIIIESNDKIRDLYIFINDELVDMDKPVKVIFNEQVKFEGLKSRSLTKLLDFTNTPIHGNQGAVFTNRIDISIK